MKRWLLLPLLVATAYGQDLTTGYTFADGETVNASKLNNAVNGAAIQPAFISGKTGTTPLTTDYLQFYQTGTGTLKKTLVGDIIGLGVSSLVMPSPLSLSASIGGITGTWTTQTANTFFAGPTTGSAATPAFRALTIKDATLPANGTVSTVIDWSASNVHDRTLTGPTTFTFTNTTDGQTIHVITRQDGTGSRTVTFPGTILWPGGSQPAATSTALHYDHWEFTKDGVSVIVGKVTANLF